MAVLVERPREALSARDTILFLGAGFSKWAADLPVAARLFDFAIGTNSAREAQRLRAVQRDKEAWDSESPNGLAEVFIQQMLDASEMKRRRVIWYVTRRLTEPFVASKLGGAQALMIDDHRAPTAPGVAQTKAVLSALGPRLSALLTTNYDLLPEYALGTAGFNYGTVGEQLIGRGKNPWFPWQGDDPCVVGELPIYKLHGSVSWDSFAKRTDGGCGVRGNALIVPPRPEKVAPVELKPVWQMASSVLRAARRLVVFGFAFNPYDEAILRFLGRNGTGIGHVLIIDPEPKVDAAHLLWPAAAIATTGPESPSASIREWLAASAT